MRKTVAALCMLAALVQLAEQGGGLTSATCLDLAYGALEVAAAVAAALLTASPAPVGWLLAATAALGPLLGALLADGFGTYGDGAALVGPGWLPPLILLTILVEGGILMISVAALATAPWGAPGSRSTIVSSRQAPRRNRPGPPRSARPGASKRADESG
jgi:hypothetical protein